MQAYGVSGPMDGLPDPERDAQFYDGVPARRLAAWLVDALVVLAIGVPIAVIFGIVTLGFGFVLFPMFLIGVSFLYRTTTIAAASATWGMRAFGIELRRSDGTRFDFATAVLHTFIYTVCFSVIVLQAISCAAMAGTRYGQGIPDIILRTTAINAPAN